MRGRNALRTRSFEAKQYAVNPRSAPRVRAVTRLLVCATVGIVAGVLTGLLLHPVLGMSVGFSAGALTFLVAVWSEILLMDGDTTRRHSVAEDSTRVGSHVALVVALLAGLASVVSVVVASQLQGSLTITLAVAGLIGAALAWAVLHTLFALRYAHLFYTEPEGGIDFSSEDAPDYRDFAYVAATVGMTYAIADTDVTQQPMRRAALVHSLMSFLFGGVILATTINLVVGLS